MTLTWAKTSVEAFVARFEQCCVGKQEWTHQAHLVTGFWYVHCLGADRALEKMRVGIRRHNESVGTPNTDTRGYHETITRLYLQYIASHIQKQSALSFENCLANLLASEVASSGWPLTLYTRERLFSVEARKSWIEPEVPQGG